MQIGDPQDTIKSWKIRNSKIETFDIVSVSAALRQWLGSILTSQQVRVGRAWGITLVITILLRGLELLLDRMAVSAALVVLRFKGSDP